jgi:hypothetical protein
MARILRWTAGLAGGTRTGAGPGAYRETTIGARIKTARIQSPIRNCSPGAKLLREAEVVGVAGVVMVDQPGGCTLPESMAVHDHRLKIQINTAISEERAAVIAAIRGIPDNSAGTGLFLKMPGYRYSVLVWLPAMAGFFWR